MSATACFGPKITHPPSYPQETQMEDKEKLELCSVHKAVNIIQWQMAHDKFGKAKLVSVTILTSLAKFGTLTWADLFSIKSIPLCKGNLLSQPYPSFDILDYF